MKRTIIALALLAATGAHAECTPKRVEALRHYQEVVLPEYQYMYREALDDCRKAALLDNMIRDSYRLEMREYYADCKRGLTWQCKNYRAMLQEIKGQLDPKPWELE